MTLTQHIKYSSIPTLILLPVIGIKALYFFLASILIDIDHYVMYILEVKSFSIRGMFRYCNDLLEYLKNNRGLALCMLHTAEFLIVIILFSFYSSIAFYVLLGIIFHLILDAIYLYRNGCLFGRAFSIVEYLIRKNNIKLRADIKNV